MLSKKKKIWKKTTSIGNWAESAEGGGGRSGGVKHGSYYHRLHAGACELMEHAIYFCVLCCAVHAHCVTADAMRVTKSGRVQF